MKSRSEQVVLFPGRFTLEEVEAIAEARALEARDKAVRLLQYEVREGRETSEAVVGTRSG